MDEDYSDYGDDFLVEYGFHLTPKGEVVYVGGDNINLFIEYEAGKRNITPREYNALNYMPIDPGEYIILANKGIRFIQSKLEQLTQTGKNNQKSGEQEEEFGHHC
jgi:hypothetical protein